MQRCESDTCVSEHRLKSPKLGLKLCNTTNLNAAAGVQTARCPTKSKVDDGPIIPWLAPAGQDPEQHLRG